jgi:hypothetical protein
LFAELLGKSEEEIQIKLDTAWEHFFYRACLQHDDRHADGQKGGNFQIYSPAVK